MEYKTLRYDMNRPVAQRITEPLNSAYGVAVKVYKDGQLLSADLSVGGTTCTEGPGGWKLAELSSGNAEIMKTLDVTAVKEAESETFEGTAKVTQKLPYELFVNVRIGPYLAGTEIAPDNVADFEMELSMTTAGGETVTETLSLDDTEFYGRAEGQPIAAWWRIVDGKWFNAL